MATTTTTMTKVLSVEPEASTVSSNLPQQQQQQQQHQPNQPLDTAASTRTIEPLNIESTTDIEANYPTGTKFWFTIIALCAVLILGGLDANIVATAVPSITNHFHTVADVGWYSSAFRLCTCAFQFAFAKLYKLFSIKTIFLISIVIFLVGSLLCATAASSIMFIVGRAVTGLGFSGELAGCFAVIVHILPLNKRPVFAGLTACVESLAIIAAPIVGGALTQSLGWRWCFWINLPIGGLSLLAMLFLFSDPRTRQEGDMTLSQKIRELDLVSNCLFIPSLTALFLALSWAGTKYPWSDGKVIALFVVFGVLLAAFVFNQYRRGDSAALPFRIIKSRSVIAGFIFTTCTNSMTNVLEWYLPTYYQVVRSRVGLRGQFTPSESGYLMIPILVGMMLGLFLQGIGTTTFGYYAPFMIFASICMPIAAGLMTTYDLHTSLAKIILYSGFVGFSGGIGFQAPQAAVQTTLSVADVNLGIGVILFGQSMGPAVFIAIAQVLFTNQLSSNLGDVVPGLTPKFIEEQGLGDIKNGVPMQRWDEVLGGIDRSLTHTCDGDCDGQCHENEVTLFTSSTGGGDYDGLKSQSGTKKCSRGKKAFCCTDDQFDDLTADCYWTGCNGKCASGETSVATASNLDDKCTIFRHSMHYCCKTSPAPLTDCHWVGKGDCADNRCSSSEVTLATNGQGDSISSCNWGRKKALCCTPGTSAAAGCQDVDPCDLDSTLCTDYNDEYGTSLSKRDLLPGWADLEGDLEYDGLYNETYLDLIERELMFDDDEEETHTLENEPLQEEKCP
ncbi:unnamed protein product [Penicillium viridicatum]